MTSKITLLLLCTALICSAAVAQNKIKTQKIAGGSADDKFSSLIVTNDGGILAGGSSISEVSGTKTAPSKGGNDYWIVKYNKLGALEWDKTIGSDKDDNLACAQQTADSGYIVGGSSYGGVSGDKTTKTIHFSDYWVVKLDKNGNIQWDKTIGDSIGGAVDDRYTLKSLQQTSDKGYIVAGIEFGDDAGYFNPIWVVKLDSSGNVQWSNYYGGAEYSAIIQQTPDGNYILGGSEGFHEEDEEDVKLFKIDKNGKEVWDKLYNGPDVAYASLSSLVQIKNGYVLGCTTFSSINDWILLRTDTVGNEINYKYIGGSGDDVLTSLAKTSDGGFLLSGYSNSPKSGDKSEDSRGGYDYWVVKLDAANNIMWDRTYGGSSDDMLYAAMERKPDEYILSGSSSSGYSGDKRVPSMGGVDFWGIVMEHTAPAVKPLIAAAPDFSVYPNPAVTTINIFTKNKTQFILSNQLGKPIATKVIDNNGNMDVSRLTSGVYFITNLSTGKKQSVVVVR